MIPARIGRYEILSELGRGAMGRVYRGRDPIVDREVAIKTLQAEEFPKRQQEEILARFRREAQAAGQLNHPNIVTIFDVGESFFVMELVKGETLQAHISRKGRLALVDTLGIVASIAAALDYAHHRGVVHRDVKPANIMVTERGVPKLMDFGLAHLDATVLTRAGQSLGSPAYMAPEQIQGHEPTPRADLYALAVVTYEMLTGSRPFAGKNITTLLHQVVHEAPLPPRHFNASLPPRYDELFEKALSKSPEDRYSDAASFVTELNLKELEAIVSLIDAPGPPMETSAVEDEIHQEATMELPRIAARPSASTTERRSGPRQRPIVGRRSLLATVLAAVALLGAGVFFWRERPGRVTVGAEMPPLAVAPQAKVSLSLTSTPSPALVFVDDKEVGRTPIQELAIEEGAHRIEVRRRGFEPFRTDVDARPGESLQYVARLKPIATAKPATARAREAPPEPLVAELGDPGVAAPVKISGDFARYPDAARKRRVSGIVTVAMVISEAGAPEELQVVESAGPLLDAAVVKSVEKWRFTPATRNGKPVRIHWRVRQHFRLEP